MKSILSIIFYAMCGAVLIQFTHPFPFGDRVNTLLSVLLNITIMESYILIIISHYLVLGRWKMQDICFAIFLFR